MKAMGFVIHFLVEGRNYFYFICLQKLEKLWFSKTFHCWCIYVFIYLLHLFNMCMWNIGGHTLFLYKWMGAFTQIIKLQGDI